MFGGAGIDTLDLSIGDFFYSFNNEDWRSRWSTASSNRFLVFEIFIFGGRQRHDHNPQHFWRRGDGVRRPVATNDYRLDRYWPSLT